MVAGLEVSCFFTHLAALQNQAYLEKKSVCDMSRREEFDGNLRALWLTFGCFYGFLVH